MLAAFAATLTLPAAGADGTAEGWRPAGDRITSRWAKEVDPSAPLPEYPRPQMVRERGWSNLNGLWDYAVRPRGKSGPGDFTPDGKVLVPFAPESALSGVGKTVGAENDLWYRRTIRVPEGWAGGRVFLHFGAVDWEAAAWVNGRAVGEHRGGYSPFAFDITHALANRAGPEHELVVRAWDPTDAGTQPRGKQVARPRGIWYTAVTGIWGTVWIEAVPQRSIARLKMVPDAAAGTLRLTVETDPPAGPGEGLSVVAVAGDEGQAVAEARGAPGAPLELKVPEAKLWSPDSPHLYDLEVRLLAGDVGGRADQVKSYFGLRDIRLGRDEAGINRLFLNGEALFQLGPLDQGWWPDGLYTAPTDAALRYDIEVTKQLGFNMARKHVKVEPARWYYHCDRLGLLVWQDMPNGDRHIRGDEPDIERSGQSADNYRREWGEIIGALFNHPSVVVWVPFNEGWGQFDTDGVLAWTKSLDPTRLVDGPSGWTDRGSGDMHDMHRYPGPDMPPVEDRRAVVLGEFGGLGLPVEKHLWWNRRNWGYRTYKTAGELRTNYATLIQRLRPLIRRGLAAAVYTQTSDVEGEVNGLMTYDRAVIKFDPAEMRRLHKPLYRPNRPTRRTDLAATSEEQPQVWRYRTEQPAEDWAAPGFDHSAWKEGAGGFGTEGTPGAIVGTSWTGPDIWLRHTFQLKAEALEAESLHLRIHHDEDAVVYLNGGEVGRFLGYITGYIDVPLEPGAAELLREGENTLAVHCRQATGGQFIDVGLSDWVTVAGEKP